MIALPTDHIQRSKRGDDVAEHAALEEFRETTRNLKTWRTDANPIGRAGPIRHEIVTELAVAALRVGVNLALRELSPPP